MALDQVHKNKRHKMKKRFIFRVMMLILILAAVIFALVLNLTDDETAVKEGDQAPNLMLTQINANNENDQIQLSDLKGKGVVLNFWATYCEPCEVQMPFLESLQSEYKDQIEIVTINLDNSEIVAQQLIDKYNLTFNVLLDKRSEIMELYGVSPIPTTFFIRPDGVVQDVVVGGLTLEQLESHFKTIQPRSME